MFKKFILATTLLMSFQAFSSTYVWHTGTVKTVYPGPSGNFIVIFNEDSPSCGQDSSNKYHNVAVGYANVTDEGAKMMLSTAMAAGIAQKTLKVYFDKESASCFINRMQIEF